MAYNLLLNNTIRLRARRDGARCGNGVTLLICSATAVDGLNGSENWGDGVVGGCQIGDNRKKIDDGIRSREKLGAALGVMELAD